MTNEIQKQYDRLEDVSSIMLRMKDVYAVPDRHIRYASTKSFFGTKMTEGPFVHSHGVKMLFLVEKLEDLKARLNNDTYIDVILQSLPPSYDPFIVNYNMNGLEKSIHELINMLIQYEATTHKSEPGVLVGEASTSKAKGKGARRWKRKKGKVTSSTGGAPPTAPKGKGKGKVRGSQRSKANDVCMHCQGKGHWKRKCPQLLSNPGMFVVEVLQRSKKLSNDEMILRLGDGKAVATETVGSPRLVVSSHIRIDLKDVYFVPKNEILSQWTPPGMPQLNGVAERRNRTLLDMVRSMMSFTELPPSFWVYALETAAKLLNIAPSKYGFVGLTSQLDNDPKIYGEAMSDIDSNKWLEAMKSKMDSMGSNQVWTLVDPPKVARYVGCKWVYKRKLGADGEVTAFKARLVAKDILNDLGSTLRKPIRQ
ncbi:UNVERIFIED_CONTAM: hypothetical protein Sradi_1893900 [Sesamum radiatum]|uniref:Uncharacterized protein n=1 Tax=Sesamum radiatum TaxID=300843 RepID=A0AAW2TXC1_SESRA